jgi:hypothetical protein
MGHVYFIIFDKNKGENEHEKRDIYLYLMRIIIWHYGTK